MNEKWARFDDTLSDLWRAFLLPIMNVTFLLLIYPEIPAYVWGIVVDLANAVASTGQTSWIQNKLGDIVKALTDTTDPTKYFDWLNLVKNGTFGALIVAAAILAVLVFILDKFTLALSRFVFGQYEIRAGCLSRNPTVATAFNTACRSIPRNDAFVSPSRKWQYIQHVNDTHGELPFYREERAKLRNHISTQKLYGTYAAAYFGFAIVAFLFSTLGLGKGTVSDLVVLLVAFISWLVFAYTFAHNSLRLMDLDLHVFISLQQHGISASSDEAATQGNSNEPTNSESDRTYMTRCVNLFRSGGVSRARQVVNVSKDVSRFLAIRLDRVMAAVLTSLQNIPQVGARIEGARDRVAACLRVCRGAKSQDQ